ncbi:hypothetical protein [Nitrosopumilus sp.]
MLGLSYLYKPYKIKVIGKIGITIVFILPDQGSISIGIFWSTPIFQ